MSSPSCATPHREAAAEAREIPLERAAAAVSAANARIVSTYGPRPVGATLENQVEWLERFTRDVERRHNQLDGEVGEVRATIGRSVAEVRKYAAKRIAEAVDDARQDFRRTVGQDLGREVLSLAVVALGVVRAAIGQ